VELSESTNGASPCRLCGGTATAWAQSIHGARYQWCAACGSIQRHPGDLPTPQVELTRYREHHNEPDNADYRSYLDRFMRSAITPYAPAGCRLLDFGSGPSPVLADMLRHEGYRVTIYDPFFAPDAAVPGAGRDAWDAVVMLEVIEHLHDPRGELARLRSQLVGDGLVILRTGVFDARDPATDPAAPERFLAWWYRRDPTHVFFLTPRTIEWLTTTFGWRCIHHKPGTELVFRIPRSTEEQSR
jgi:2-polyprenyl-3-methyl-5-hydroxy-6-metoxy-1,4-benzoquinol methylase